MATKSRRRYKVYNSTEVLPLWNFIKIKETNDFKYLYKADREDYFEIELKDDLTKEWDNICDEFAKIDQSVSVVYDIQNQIYWRHSQYLVELNMIRWLLFDTNVEYIQELRQKGYRLRNTSNQSYWEDLEKAFQRVKHHINQMDRLRNQLPKKEEDRQTTSFYAIIAWLSSQMGYDVKDSITVAAYLEYSKIIKKKLNGKRSK